MRIFTGLITMMLAQPALAKGFERPIPMAQSATAEFWFAVASLALIGALALVGYLVARR